MQQTVNQFLEVVEKEEHEGEEIPELSLTEDVLLNATHDMTRHELYMKVGCNDPELDIMWNEILRVRAKDEDLHNWRQRRGK